MVVNIPTNVIPLWFIEKWTRENAEVGSALDVFVKAMIKDWSAEEARLSK